jgi:hypothetical protein
LGIIFLWNGEIQNQTKTDFINYPSLISGFFKCGNERDKNGIHQLSFSYFGILKSGIERDKNIQIWNFINLPSLEDLLFFVDGERYK